MQHSRIARSRLLWSLRLAGLAALASTAIACGAAPASGGAGIAKSPSGPTATPPTTKAFIVATDDDPGGNAQEVFERATKLLDAGQPQKARVLFDRVIAADRAERAAGAEPSALGRSAAFDAALCSEQLDQPADARDRHRALAASLMRPDGSTYEDARTDAADALVHRARLDIELEDDPDLDATTKLLGAFTEIGGTAHAEILALSAIAKIHAGELDVAEKMLIPARKAVDPGDDGPMPAPAHAATVHFAQGELLRARGLSIKFVPLGPDFGDRMETRCQHILDAENAYVDTIKTKEPRWAVRSGLRVASMYIALHDDLVVIPPPKSADTDARKALFRGAMRLRYRILLEKGLGTLDKTLNIEGATGVKTAWFEHTRRAKEQLERTLAEEKAEIAKLPYTEEQLQKAFDDLSGKSATSKPSAPTKKT